MELTAVMERVARLRRQGTDDALTEAKAAAGGLPKNLWDTVSAFANTDGGLILLGLDERSGFLPAQGFSAQACLNAVRAGLSDNEKEHPKVTPLPHYEVQQIEVDGAPVIAVEISSLVTGPHAAPPSAQQPPCFVIAKGVVQGSYKRMGDADVRLSPYEIYQLSNRYTPEHYDLAPIEGQDLASLSHTAVSALLNRLHEGESQALTGIEPGDTAGALQRLNAATAHAQPTLAGYLTLGTYPQQACPQLLIDVTAHPTTAKGEDGRTRFTDRRLCDGPLPVAIDAAVATVLRNLRMRRVVRGTEGTDVPEIPAEVLREAITNAVMHRDYSPLMWDQAVAVDIYPDRVEVTNPGSFKGDRTKDNILVPMPSFTRNPALAGLLRRVPRPGGVSTVAEVQGSGIPRMIAAMREQGLPRPDYSASTIDHVVVRLARFGLLDPQTQDWLTSLPHSAERTQAEKLALALAHHDGSVSVADLRRRIGLDSDECREVLGNLRADALLVGVGDGPYTLAPAPGPSLTETEQAILASLSPTQETSARDVATTVGKSLATVRVALRGLVDEGLVLATAPPQSRRRRYLRAEPAALQHAAPGAVAH